MTERTSMDKFLGQLEESGMLDGFTGRVENVEDTSKNLPTKVDIDGNRYEIEISTSKFDVLVNKNSHSGNLFVVFPALDTDYDLESIEGVINPIFSLAFPNHNHTPSPLAAIVREQNEERFDLRDAWDLRKFRLSLKDKGYSGIYFKPPEQYNLPLPNYYSYGPDFIYGFKCPQGSDSESREYFQLSEHRAGSTIYNGLYQDILHRHRNYLGRNDEADAEDMAAQIQLIAKESFPPIF